MKWTGIAVVCVLSVSGCQSSGTKPELAAANAAGHSHIDAAANDARPVRLISGLGSTHHAVSTKSPQAQKFFDQGLAYCYAFNHAEAVRSFKRAAEIDPACAMAY